MNPIVSHPRIYVDVELNVKQDGVMRPVAIRWTDGRRFEIDQIQDVRRAAALKCGGQGCRYTIRIGEQVRYLFFEYAPSFESLWPGRWFIEPMAG